MFNTVLLIGVFVLLQLYFYREGKWDRRYRQTSLRSTCILLRVCVPFLDYPWFLLLFAILPLTLSFFLFALVFHYFIYSDIFQSFPRRYQQNRPYNLMNITLLSSIAWIRTSLFEISLLIYSFLQGQES